MDERVNGLKLCCTDSAEPNLPPIVFIHGFPLTQALWRAQVEALRGVARTVTYDLRGFGGSELGLGRHAFESYIDDLLALLDHLRIARAILCGLSMGGYVALRAAEAAPGRLAGLVLADTRSQADAQAARLKRAEQVQAIERDGVAVFAESFLKGVLAPETFSKRPEVVESARKIILGNSAAGICAALLAMAGRTDTTASLGRIAVPTLVLNGEQDALTPPETAKQLAAAIPAAKLAIIPGAGHLSCIENPREFNLKLLEFIRDQIRLA